MTREEARAHWAASGLSYADLTKKRLSRLRKMIDGEMRKSGCIGGTMRAGRAATMGGRYGVADIRCQAHYFKDRQAVTFENGGFIGFAGWADETNVQPILSAFVAWVDEVGAERGVKFHDERQEDAA
jgi:hypothetical protein